MNEWGFGGEIKSWWDATIAKNPEWRLSRCSIEDTSEGSAKRSDLVVYDDSDRPVLALELRLPDHPNPSPHAIDNIDNALGKANRLGARWSATTDGAEFVLLDNSKAAPTAMRGVPVAPLAVAATRELLTARPTRERIRAAWEDLLCRIAPVLTGQAKPAAVPPDEFFVESLRASLVRPVADIRDEISHLVETDSDFRHDLIRWMVDKQGWTHDKERFDEEVARVAQVSTYVFATRLLFYTALRRAQPGLPSLSLPPEGYPATTQALVEALFQTARKVTGDYETVFTFDDICRYALISESSCRGWVRVIELLGHFKLEEIGYDVLGKLFERLIDPHERYEWGQHYTNPDVVDLMLSFAIPDGKGIVLDPACGGGTFLVRAYSRKKALNARQDHGERLQEIAGADISAFAASVATIGLASQNLESGANYPQVRESSFFRLAPDREFIELPSPAGGRDSRTISDITAVVCNPPYIKYDMIGEGRLNEANLALRADWPHQPPLRSRFNYHLYFWFHSAKFLKGGGRLLFITSGEWLDSDYGAQLQEWLLNNFHVEVVIESMAEPWFSEARVGTVVMSLRRLHLKESIESLETRFVTLREPLSKLYITDRSMDHHQGVDALRDRFLRLQGFGESPEFDHAVIEQRALYDLGLGESGKYLQVPWRSRFLRAPKLALELSSHPDFSPVSTLGTVRLGLKTGADSFFFVKITDRPSAPSPKVDGSSGWKGRISREDLLPALQNPRDLDIAEGRRFIVRPSKMAARYLFPRMSSRGAGLKDYVAHGERLRVHQQPLVRQNASADAWFRQTRSIVTSRWALPYNSAYDYFAVDNAVGAVLNGRFVGVDAKPGIDEDLLGAVLNSTFSLMTRLLVGTATGNEGAFDVGPPALRTMMVPDVRNFRGSAEIAEVHAALQSIREADVIPPGPSPTGQVHPLRRRLDSSILRALGSTAGEAAVLLDRVYLSYARWRTAVEAVEDQVQSNRRALGKRGGQRSLDPTIKAVKNVFSELQDERAIGFTDLTRGSYDLLDIKVPHEDMQEALLPRTRAETRDGTLIELTHPARLDLARLFRKYHWTGAMPLPVDARLCTRFLEDFARTSGRILREAERRAAHYVGDVQAAQVAENVLQLCIADEFVMLKTQLEPQPEPEDIETPYSAASLFDTAGLVPPAPVQ